MPGETKSGTVANAKKQVEETVVSPDMAGTKYANEPNNLSDAHAVTAGGNLTASAPVMTPDSKYFLCGADNKVHVYSVITGLRVHTLTGHNDTVTAISISPENPLQAYTCSLDGDVRVWDYLDAVCLKVYCVGLPLIKMLMTAQAMSEKRALYVIARPSKFEMKTYRQSKKAPVIVGKADGDDAMDIDTTEQEETSESKLVEDGGASKDGEKEKEIMETPEQEETSESKPVEGGETSKDEKKEEEITEATEQEETSESKPVVDGGKINAGKKGKKVTKPGLRIFEVYLDAKFDTSTKNKFNKKITVGGVRKEKVHTRLVIYTSSIRDWTFSHDGKYLALVSKTSLIVIDLPKKHRTKFEGRARFSTVRFHPDGDIMATGDEQGRVTLWYSFREVLAKEQKKVHTSECITSTLHWHAHAVSSIAFTSDGAYLLSGGVEAVLVIWSLSDSSKQFLPRLGAPIRSVSISANEEMYLVGYVTNTIHIVSVSSLKILKEVRGLVLRPPAVVHRHHNYGLTNKNNKDTISSSSTTGISSKVRACIPLSLSVNPKDNSTVAFNRLPGSVQFYDVLSDKPVSTMGVVQHMYVSGTQSAQIDQPLTDVRHVAYTFKGEGLITVEGKINEPRLKFWDWDDSAHSFTLNTFTDTAHSDEVLSVGVDPAHNVACTTSLDGTIKLWVMNRVRVLATTPKTDAQAAKAGSKAAGANGTEEQIQWSKSSTASYRGMTPYCCAFSNDGSLLAVGFDHVITLWAPETNTLMRSLMHTAGPSQPITSVSFATIPSKSLPLLIAATPDYLFVWNLLTCTVYWSYKVKVTLLTTVPRFSTNSSGHTEGYFAIVARLPGFEGRYPEVVVEFSAESPVPLRISPVPKRESVEGLAYLTGNRANTSTSASRNSSETAKFVKSANASLGLAHTTPPALAVATTCGIIRMVGGDTVKHSKSKSQIAKEAHIDNSDVFAAAKPGVSANAYVAASGVRESNGSTDTGLKPSEVVFTAPSHLVPPCTALYESFMTLLLDNSRTSSKEADEKLVSEDADMMDIDIDMTASKNTNMATMESGSADISNGDMADEYSYLEAVFATNLINPTSVPAQETKAANGDANITSGSSKKKSSKKSKKSAKSSEKSRNTDALVQTNGIVESGVTAGEENAKITSPKSPKKASSKNSRKSSKKKKVAPSFTPNSEITTTTSAQVTPAPSKHSKKSSNKKRKAPTSV
ncbi:hypothetical protein SARC_10080 [Sphaeroforma arctica JP610]|uniref:WD repeat-containing protein 75 second beta-propeller domain-containing protein n=1 Tax=Sphaeroforma arctica JP610 TaxID=667725 RepID=A0A0L0FKZ6_9EUKA|nr:hypothetical protein SARC_10080 [Sphaeroforma arctica JP610]KNC77459.1 hypothetical protein SARC_10080 [Sphaeroforma arctica JP610]|eukprot:XP_014151361.1 hypothetical protein SARC_10080 [Sphaeroforma arctica JP610]